MTVLDFSLLRIVRVKSANEVENILMKGKSKHEKMLAKLINHFKEEYPQFLFGDIGELRKTQSFQPKGKGFKAYKPDIWLKNKKEEQVWLESEEKGWNIFEKIIKLAYLKSQIEEWPEKIVFISSDFNDEKLLALCKELWEYFKIPSQLQIFWYDEQNEKIENKI